MNPINEPSDTESQPPEKLYQLLFGPIRWQLIQVALELKLFDELEAPKDSKSLAQKLNIRDEKLRLLLNGLSSLQLITQDKSLYRINPVFAPYLISHSPLSMREMLLHLSQLRHADSETIKEILHGKESTHKSVGLKNSAFWDQGYRTLGAFHRSMGIPVFSDILTSLPIWNNTYRLLDLGAGTDALANTLLALKPELNIWLFDLPSCAHAITTHINDSSKINVIAGDYNKDKLGGPYDLVWSSMSLYFAKDIKQLFANIRKTLNTDGAFVSFHEALQNNRTVPEMHVTGRFLPAINGNDLSFNDGYIAEHMLVAGFKKIDSQFITTPFGEFRVDVGYAHDS